MNIIFIIIVGIQHLFFLYLFFKVFKLGLDSSQLFYKMHEVSEVNVIPSFLSFKNDYSIFLFKILRQFDRIQFYLFLILNSSIFQFKKSQYFIFKTDILILELNLFIQTELP